jgi:predicted RNA polymerase sigma factor
MLEDRKWDDAISRFTGVIDLLTKPADPRWNKVLSVACRLRAAAHEGAGRRSEALADFDRALALAPDDAEAQGGKKRLSPP